MTSGLFSYSSLVHALSGAAGSVTGMTVFFPLDTARTRLQVDDDRRASGPLAAILVIAREEGWQSLYRGLGPVLTSISCANFVYFYAFNGLKRLLRRRGIQSSPWTDLAVGSLAGVVNVLTTSPLFVANTRMKLQGARLRTPTVPQNTRYTGIVGNGRAGEFVNIKSMSKFSHIKTNLSTFLAKTGLSVIDQVSRIAR
eukprot:m.15163 g.15163  ORF g.15163 m.15163 type:complete len:198 (+) comp26224_c0_seq3:66-659(+)